jgi:hypothetical protein
MPTLFHFIQNTCHKNVAYATSDYMSLWTKELLVERKTLWRGTQRQGICNHTMFHNIRPYLLKDKDFPYAKT